MSRSTAARKRTRKPPRRPRPPASPELLPDPVPPPAPASSPAVTTQPEPASSPAGSPSEADPEEIARAVAAIRATAPPPTPAPPSPGGPDAASDALIDAAERVAEGDTAILADISAQELADIYQLGFGLAADYRGPHWALEDRAALRLGTWTRRVIDHHGLAWAAAWIPDLFAVLLLGYEISKRIRTDRELAALAAAAEPAPA